jgi:LacI family transcriptional regulator
VPTIKDIAKAAGVSVATVSYVINNTRWVHEDKRKRVLEAVTELNYVPNSVARGLRVQKNMTIGFIVTDITNPFYPDLSKACEDVAQEHGFYVNVVNTNDDADRMQMALTQLRRGRFDGIVTTSAMEHDRENIDSLVQQGYPIVLASRFIEDLRVDSVVADNRRGAEMATRYFIDLGHKKIAFIGGIIGSSVTFLRISGYLNAMAEAGLQVYPEYIARSGAQYSGSYDAATKLFEMPVSKRPTAVISLNDIGALGVLDAAKDKDVNVPDDLAVIGFDDLFISGTRRIQLTTVKISRYEMGSIATSLLFERMKKGNTGDFENIVLPVELIVRKTCGGKA